VTRAQSHVVGVALLLGITTVALAGLTVTLATTVDTGTAAVTERQVSAGFTGALRPRRVTGPHESRIGLPGGQLRTVERTVRLANETGVVASVEVDALVYCDEGVRVGFLAGAVVRGGPTRADRRSTGTGRRPTSSTSTRATLVREPSVAVTDDTLFVGVAALGDGDEPASVSLGIGERSAGREVGEGSAGSRGRRSLDGGRSATTAVTVATNVTHSAETHPSADWRLAVETATPDAFARHFRSLGANTDRREYDDDGVPSVVVTFDRPRRLVFVVHRLDVEVRLRG
jgi:hypothetical protein